MSFAGFQAGDEYVMHKKTLRELLKLGNKVRLFFNEGNINNKIIHILAIVDDDYIVYKTWGRRKQQWYYQVEYIHFFELLYEKKQIMQVLTMIAYLLLILYNLVHGIKNHVHILAAYHPDISPNIRIRVLEFCRRNSHEQLSILDHNRSYMDNEVHESRGQKFEPSDKRII